MVTWNWDFNLGTILPLIFAAGVFYAITKADMRMLKDNVTDIKAQLKAQTEIITQLAVQQERLDQQAKDIAQLREEILLIHLSQKEALRRKTVDGD